MKAFNEEEFLKEYGKSLTKSESFIYSFLTVIVAIGLTFLSLFFSCLISTGWENKEEKAMWCIILFLCTISSFLFAYIIYRIVKNENNS